MIKICRYIIILGCICYIFSCHQNKAFDRESLLTHYKQPEDSFKRKALAFILDNIDDQNSAIPTFIDLHTEKIVSFDISSIKNDALFLQTMKRFYIKPYIRMISDTLIVNNTFLLNNIDLAFEQWNKFPWADSVPLDIFLNYLLPYKIFGEEPSKWRTFFTNKNQNLVSEILSRPESDSIKQSANAIYYYSLENDLDDWFVYNPNPVRLTQYPGFRELMAMKSGDCFGWAYLEVMVLRSLGIPSTIDYIPVWGRKNGTHCTEVFWDDEQQRLRTASGREFEYPAKVFRYTFKKQNIWTDSIIPVIKRNPFILDFLKHDHWLDVTQEHTKTKTIEYGCNILSDFAYICVFNYGQWIPVYWGKINEGKVRFENMGTNILYRIAIPQNNSYKLVSSIFLFDEKGNKKFFKPNLNKKINPFCVPTPVLFINNIK